jgi:tetratricopeptide (TPR) repeat protein
MKKRLLYLVLLTVFLIIIFVLVNNYYSLSFTPSDRIYQKVNNNGVASFEHGYLEYKEGLPFLYVKGDSYEIGLQYGVLLQNEMKRFYAEADSVFDAMLTTIYNKSPWYHKILIKIFTPFVMKRKIKSFIKRVPEEYLLQLKGMSEGSKVPLDKILSVTFGGDLQCSSFIKKHGDRIIHGRNADYEMPFIGKYPLISHYNKNGKYSYIDIGIIGTPFVCTGINEHGLTLSWSQATYKPIKGTGTMLIFNKIMEECRNLKDVNEISKNVDRFVVMIGSMDDRSGAAYDIVNNEIVKTNMKENIIYATNRCLSQNMRKKYNSISDMDWTNIAREEKYKEFLCQGNEFNIKNAVDILSNTDFYNYRGKLIPYRGWETINNQNTLSSVILDPKFNTIYFAYNTHFAGLSKWIKYNYKNNKVFVYRKEDVRLTSTFLSEFLKIKQQLRNLDWEDKVEVKQFALMIEQASFNNSWTLHVLWLLYNSLGDFDKAEKAINKIIELYPDLELGYDDMGDLYKNQKKYDDAIKYFKKALEAPISDDESRAYIYEQLALIYHEIGDETELRNYGQKALNLYKSYWVPEYLEKNVNRMEKLLKNKN